MPLIQASAGSLSRWVRYGSEGSLTSPGTAPRCEINDNSVLASRMVLRHRRVTPSEFLGDHIFTRSGGFAYLHRYPALPSLGLPGPALGSRVPVNPKGFSSQCGAFKTISETCLTFFEGGQGNEQVDVLSCGAQGGGGSCPRYM
eukprot:2519928-Rhodomonas_salina.1